MRPIGLCLLLLLSLSACKEDFSQGGGDVVCDHPGGPGFDDSFESATFPTHWVQQGPGTVEFAAGAGSVGSGLRLDSTGASCQLLTDPLGANHVGMSAEFYIAIDPTPGSGAQGTFSIINMSGAVLASVTVREGFIDYELPGLAPQTFAWTTDGQFHRFRLVSSHSGTTTPYSAWERDGSGAFAGGLPITDLQVRFSIGGASPANVFFDEGEAHFFGDCPAQ